jgi:hypothetical protein
MVGSAGIDGIIMVEIFGYKVLETCGDGVYFSPTPRVRNRMTYPINQWVEDKSGHGLYMFRSHQDARAWIKRQTRPEGGQGAMLGKIWAIWECRCDGDIRPSDNPDNPEELRVSKVKLIRIVERWPGK